MTNRMPRPTTRMSPTKMTAWGFWTTSVDSMAIMAMAMMPMETRSQILTSSFLLTVQQGRLMPMALTTPMA